MANYASQAETEATVGMTFTTTTRPTLVQMGVLLSLCDEAVNSVMLEDANITDIYGYLKAVTLQLFRIKFNNILWLSSPERYDYISDELTKDQIALIRTTHKVWAAKTWDVGQ